MNRMIARSALVTLGFLVLGLLQPINGAARWHSISDFAHNVRSVCRNGIKLEVAFTGTKPQTLRVHVPPSAESVVAEKTLVIPFNPITVDDVSYDFHGFFIVRFDQRLAPGTRLGLAFGDEGVNETFSVFKVHRCLLSNSFHGELATGLSGFAEIEGGEPGAGDPNGAGVAKITLKPKSNRVCFELRWRKIGRPTAAHIHAAPAGVNGPIVRDLLTSSDTIRHEDGRGRASGCVKGVIKSLIRDIELHPATFYVNIHTNGFPAGAIRGNLRKA
jgi:hypothetical protein